MKRIDVSRREFLRASSALSILGPVATPFGVNLATIGAAERRGDRTEDRERG